MEVKVNCRNRQLELWLQPFESQVIWDVLYAEDLPYGRFEQPLFCLTANCLTLARHKRYGATDEEIIAFLMKKLGRG